MPNDLLAQLVTMSNNLGDPALDYVILGEGNTSCRADRGTFWVKASGTELRTMDRSDFVRVSFERILALLGAADLTDEQVKQGLSQARVDPLTGSGSPADDGLLPSIETMLHAVCLNLKGIHFVGHTHPPAVNAILCSQRVEEAIQGRLFPEEITFCGPAPAFVPYTDPGLPLARRLQDVLTRYLDDYEEPPRVILLQNHGFIALGRTPAEVENATAMYAKAARVLLGTYALGGPRFLTSQDVQRIHRRPDEVYRRERLSGRAEQASTGMAVAAISSGKVQMIGLLGLPLGQVCRVEGVFFDGSELRTKAFDGVLLMSVSKVNGAALEKTFLFRFHEFQADILLSMAPGTAFDVIAYETGGYVGVPPEAWEHVPAATTTDHFFETFLTVLKDASPSKPG